MCPGGGCGDPASRQASPCGALGAVSLARVSEAERPLLANVYPALISYLDAKLIADGEPALAAGLVRLRFYGWCRCSLNCTYLRTAPAGRADSLWLLFDEAEEPSVWVQFDRDHASFAGMEILEFKLGPAPALDPDRPDGMG